jgi:hypothetical protein
MKTEEQIKGTKFEIWLEDLLKELGCQDVLRNVYFYKERCQYRQVDICYKLAKKGRIYRVIVEAKYSSNGNIPYKLRSNKIKKEGSRKIEMENLVYEVRERKHFTKAGLAFLVTNKGFEDKVREEAERYNIQVVDGRRLQKIYNNLGYKGSIDEAIDNVELKRSRLKRYNFKLS